MGDPSGVGPEIIVRALDGLPAEAREGITLIGDGDFFSRALELTSASLVLGRDVGFVEVSYPQRDAIRDAQATAGGGHAAFACIARAVELARGGAIDAIVTAPINKAALHMAGHHYDGHTGLLREMTASPTVYMLLASEKLSTIHVSTHVSLAEAVCRCTKARVLATIEAGDAHFRAMGVAVPRIAVAGLNPHAGEGGLFGKEDDDAIAPAVEAARVLGIDAVGPISGDTVFLRASRGEFDLVVAQYHDQGHIPTKLIAFDEAVNVTLGLPILRTSVDHGTAFDIAWQGRANDENMRAAINYARRMVR